jgi:hypothetical protein
MLFAQERKQLLELHGAKRISGVLRIVIDAHELRRIPCSAQV